MGARAFAMWCQLRELQEATSSPEKVKQLCTALNQHLSTRTFLSSHAITNEDAQAVANIDAHELFSKHAQCHLSFPHLFRWAQHCRSTSAPTTPLSTTSSSCVVAEKQQAVLTRLLRVGEIASQVQARLAELVPG